jgi:hypothetical protein
LRRIPENQIARRKRLREEELWGIIDNTRFRNFCLLLLVPKNISIKLQDYNFDCCLFRCEAWHITMTKDKGWDCRRIGTWGKYFGLRGGGAGKINSWMRETLQRVLHNFYSFLNMVSMNTRQSVKWEGLSSCMGEEILTYGCDAGTLRKGIIWQT